MKRILLTGNGAAAWGARLAGVDYVPAFPITLQTEIIESLAGWVDIGEMKGRFAHLFQPARNETLLAEIQGRVDAYWDGMP